jgi:hypothetical protein
MYPVAPWSSGAKSSVLPTMSARPRTEAPDLVAALHSLDELLGDPDSDPLWLDRVLHRLARVEEAFAAHVDETEGRDGVYADAARHDGRLASRAQRLCREHIALESRIASLKALVRSPEVHPTAVQRPVRALITELRKHRQRGAGLVFEAYRDLGGDG